jgi:hypothetical protein
MKASPRLIALTLLAFTVFSTEAKQYPNENQKKADYLYQITKFIEWSDLYHDASPMNFCVYGEDPFFGALDTIDRLKVKSRELNVRYIKQEIKIAHCHILYITHNQPKVFIQKHYPLITKNAILTISEHQDFARDGGIIQFGILEDKLSIEVNLKAAEDANIKIRANLLEVANKVYQYRLN